MADRLTRRTLYSGGGRHLHRLPYGRLQRAPPAAPPTAAPRNQHRPPRRQPRPPLAAPPQQAPAAPAAASSDAQWQALLDAARKEGKVAVQTPAGAGYRRGAR